MEIYLHLLTVHKLSKRTPDAALAYGLTTADLLMGVYFAIVSSVSLVYRGSFYTIISSWTRSPLCLSLSMINFLSSECSLLMLTILSVIRFRDIDRIGDLKGMENTILVLVVSFYLLTALFGLLDLDFLSLSNLKLRNNMCVLFIISHSQHVQTIESYFQIIYVVINVLCLLCFFASLVGLFNTVMKSSLSLTKLQGNMRNKAQARIVKTGLKLVVLLMCNAICWVPILVESTLILVDVKISEQILQWMVILVIPFSATFYPVLYNMQLFENVFQKVTCKTL